MLQEEDRETGILGHPLDPQVLRKVGALKDFPPPPSGFRPEGEWTQSYRILGCHGYSDTGNDTLGFLKISRIPGDPFQFFLKEARVALNDGREFGEGGEGFVRLNFACPRRTLSEALDRMRSALQRL